MAKGTRSAKTQKAADDLAKRASAIEKQAEERFPVSTELFILQSFNGDLEEHNQANFEGPWYMFNHHALVEFFASPPPDGLNDGGSSRTRYTWVTVFPGPQYPILLARSRHADKYAETTHRTSHIRRYPDFVVWCLKTKHPEILEPFSRQNVKNHNQVLQYYKGPATVVEATPLLFVEVKNLPSLQGLRNLPDDLIKGERKVITKAQRDLNVKVAIYFLGAPEVEQAVALAWAGTNFSWTVFTRGIKCEDLEAEDPGPLETAKATVAELWGDTSASEDETRSGTPASDNQTYRGDSRRLKGILGGQVRRSMRTKQSAGRGRTNQAPQQAGSAASQAANQPRKSAQRLKAEALHKFHFMVNRMQRESKREWSTPQNWNDIKSALEKAALWDAIHEVHPGVEFWPTT